MILATMIVACLITGLNMGQRVDENGVHSRTLAEWLSPAFMLPILIFSAPGIVTGIGIFLGKAWGFWLAGVLCLLSLLPAVFGVIAGGAESIGMFLPCLPALAILWYCSFRLRSLSGALSW